MEGWSNRFFSSTRGQVVQLLRRGEATVNDLAAALSLTRQRGSLAHLSTLERDGLVRQSGKRTATRKPEGLFSLTPEAGQLFPKAYDLLFNQLLHSLGSRITSAEKDQLLREVGRRLAGVRAPLSKSPTEAELRERLKIAIDVLRDLGGLAELEDAGDEIVIRGFELLAGLRRQRASRGVPTCRGVAGRDHWRARAGGVRSQRRTTLSLQTEQMWRRELQLLILEPVVNNIRAPTILSKFALISSRSAPMRR